MYEKYDEQGNVICQECGLIFKVLTNNHMKKFHNMSLNNYSERYPGYPIARLKLEDFEESEDFVKITILDKHGKVKAASIRLKEFLTDKLKKCLKEIMETESNKCIVNTNKVDINELRKDIEREIHAEMLKNEPKDINFMICLDQYDTKEEIYIFLKKIFPGITIDFMIKEFLPGNNLAFQYMTDMAFPSKKLDIEFNEAFWHNDLNNVGIKRENDLKSRGWKVLYIDGKAPDKYHVLEKLQEIMD